MTPARRAEIRAYINRLDLDRLPPWTVEQAIIRDLWEALPTVWDEGWDAARDWGGGHTGWQNPYRTRADAS